MLGEVTRRGRPKLGTHAGFCDLFLPVRIDGKVVAVLVVGPFSNERPDSSRILSRWRGLTGQKGKLSDPKFAAYVRMTLATLVLDAGAVAAFRSLLLSLAGLIGSEGRADALANEVQAKRLELERVRSVERNWEAVHEMIDERWSRAQYSASLDHERYLLGLSRATDQVLVGLAVAQRSLEPVDELVRCDAFQRLTATLSREMGDMISGRLGDHGVVVLSGRGGSPSEKKRALRTFADRVATSARQLYGLSVHFGASANSASRLAADDYQAALAAAEAALTQGTRIVVAEPRKEPPQEGLREMRDDLARVAAEQPSQLVARFDRYAEACSIRGGYRLEATRRQLEIAFERLTLELSKSGALASKSRRALEQRVDRLAEQARSVGEVMIVYREAVADLADAVRRPVPARRDRGLRSAVEYVHEHFGEPIGLDAVAKVAGFAPKYFSVLFHEREHITFAAYLAKLRLDRAKHLLSGTDLSVARVAERAGYTSPQYFCRAFRQATGKTPASYRREVLPRLVTER
jgi:AraC-like DNA-binding protein